jgi:hypothetical protein
VSVIVSISAVVVTFALGWFAALRSQYERVLDVLHHISSDGVARARHNLGLIVHDSQSRQQANVTSQPDRVNDLFVVLWAFGRIDAVRQTLPRWNLPAFLGGGPLVLLKSSTRVWVTYWHDHLGAVVYALGPDIDIRGSDEGFRRLEMAWLQP